jgi:hypothetical protein
VDVDIDEIVELDGRIDGGWSLVAPSPFNP